MVNIHELTRDEGYRWREDFTETMSPDAIREFLLNEGKGMEAQEELDSAYAIYREMVWRFPEDGRAWAGLQRTARRLGLDEEERVAAGRV